MFQHRRSVRLIFATLAGAALLLAAQVRSGAADQKIQNASIVDKGKAQSRYLIISPHTADQCLAALDALEAMPVGKAELPTWNWGCLGGDHTGYVMVNAASAPEALAHVPDLVRAQAKAIPLNTFSAEQIKSFHEKH